MTQDFDERIVAEARHCLAEAAGGFAAFPWSIGWRAWAREMHGRLATLDVEEPSSREFVARLRAHLDAAGVRDLGGALLRLDGVLSRLQA